MRRCLITVNDRDGDCLAMQINLRVQNVHLQSCMDALIWACTGHWMCQLCVVQCCVKHLSS